MATASTEKPEIVALTKVRRDDAGDDQDAGRETEKG